MPDYFKPKVYIKDESFDPLYKTINPRFYWKSRMLPALLLSTGVIILGTQVAIPLFFFKTQDNISKPVESTVLGVASGFRDFEFNELKTKEDITTTGDIPEYFEISIPKLNIKDAKVQTNSKDLNPNNNLGHYMGSALPGNTGNAFIYGHSVLPWFFNPKNYKTIFSTLNNLNTGDEIYIKYNNKELAYKVEIKELQTPDKVNPLAEFKPKYLNESTLTLMTCWPPGTKAKRLLIKSVAVD